VQFVPLWIHEILGGSGVSRLAGLAVVMACGWLGRQPGQKLQRRSEEIRTRQQTSPAAVVVPWWHRNHVLSIALE
jgi:hypothetical protein